MIPGTPFHLGIAVRDLDRAMRNYASLFGLEHWATLHTEGETIFRGRPARAIQEIGFARWGDSYLELVEPVSGDGPASDFLRHHGEGAFHVGYFYEDELGPNVLPEYEVEWEAWLNGELRAINFDTFGDLGLQIEFVVASGRDDFEAWMAGARRLPPPPQFGRQ